MFFLIPMLRAWLGLTVVSANPAPGKQVIKVWEIPLWGFGAKLGKHFLKKKKS